LADLTLSKYRAGMALGRNLPRPLADALGQVAARASVWLSPDRRVVVERNLERVHGRKLSPLELRREVGRTFAAYARYYADTARLPTLTTSELDAGFSYEGLDHIEDARATGIGPILALPHLGSWEWAGMWIARVPRIPITVVVEPLEHVELREWMVNYREELGMNIVELGAGSAPAIMRALRNRHVVCLICDRDITGDGVEVEFFGEVTTLPAGPAMLAIRTGAPVLPTAVYNRGAINHAVALPPLEITREGNLRADVVRITQQIAHALEDLISEAPEQWHVMQPNWPSDRELLRKLGARRAQRLRPLA
jgi:lauroyl/myristoyl acyltransferase